jgi:hypothetical protein
VFIAAAAAVTTACLFAVGSDVWNPSKSVRTTLVVAAGALAFVSALAAAIEEYRGGVAAAMREKVAFVLRALAFDLQDAVGLDVRELGVSAYVLRREVFAPWRLRLARLHRERPAWSRATAGVHWRPGKGVVGRCVAEGKDVAVDLIVLDKALRDVTRRQWSSTDAELRLGLSWREYQRVRGKYGVVVASPIIDDRGPHARVIGCVAVDAPPGSLKKVTPEPVRERVATAATAILRLVL